MCRAVALEVGSSIICAEELDAANRMRTNTPEKTAAHTKNKAAKRKWRA
jgi:hypothetical protein